MPTEVLVLRAHEWRGEPRKPGDTYVVEGDDSITEDEYLRTITAFGLAEVKAESPAKAGKKRAA